ncbi:MAG: cupin domain-containing protein [Erysipelotrichaceae bacterium]|nr:cupin domain-containing protein [Erysipelotrichaceae bacterium]
MKIGKKIKELRTKYNLTQEELANRLELTKGYISQLENDLTEPSISTLEDIVLALGTNLGDFFNDEKELNKVVYKKEDYFVKENVGSNITWLVTNSQKNHMEPIMVTIQPKCQTDIDYPHEGQEFGYVLEGEVLLCIDKKTYRLKKGETFYFDSAKNHYLKNVKDKICKVIWVSSPPNF